jgi:hypothetical protein
MWALFLLLQVTALGGQAGINGYPSNAPTISALAESVDANTVVLTWTTSIASDSRAACGSEQSPDNGIDPAATSHSIVVAGLTPSTGYTCTVQSGAVTANIAATTTALAATTPITGISLGAMTDYNTTPVPACTMTGDTYYNTRSNDGITYMLTMDTSGWNCQPNNSSALQLAKFTHETPNLVGSTVNYLTAYPYNYPTPTAKAGGLMSIAGQLYVLFTRLGVASNPYYEPITAGSYITSPDHGATWNNFQTPSTYTATGSQLAPPSAAFWPQGFAGTNFSSNHFIMYGADDGTRGNSVTANRFNDGNAYVYIISLGYGTGSNSSVNNNDNAYLMRVPRSKIGRLNVTDYQYYVSGDGNLDSSWSSNYSSAGTILSNTAELGWSFIQYIPVLNRYLWLTFYYPSGAGPDATDSVWLEYESATPWGTWTQIGTQSFPSTGFYSPMILTDTALSAGLSPTTMTYLTTESYALPATYNLFYGTMTVNH